MRVTLSKDSVKNGVKWLMGDGFKNAKEARAAEKAFNEGLKKINEEEKKKNASD